MKLKLLFLETRPQFLLLSVVLAFLGTSIAWYDGFFNLGYALLAGFGLLFTHISVNTLNDYFDYRSGLDLATKRTPFSGGSGFLPAALLTPGQVFWLGMSAFLLAVGIGVFFIIAKGWLLRPLLLLDEKQLRFLVPWCPFCGLQSLRLRLLCLKARNILPHPSCNNLQCSKHLGI